VANTPKRQPGRPKKDPLQKGEQFSIRLDTHRKLELELLARSMGVSLSQAVDYAIKEASQTHTIEGQPVAEVARRGLDQVRSILWRGLPSERKENATEIIFLVMTHQLAKLCPASFKALSVPASLRSEEEAFFVEAINEFHAQKGGVQFLAKQLANKEMRLDEIFGEARQAMAVGVDPKTFVEFKLEPDHPANGLVPLDED